MCRINVYVIINIRNTLFRRFYIKITGARRRLYNLSGAAARTGRLK